MGYRLDVTLGISFLSHEALIAFASAQRATGNEQIREALKEYCITHHADGCIMWAKFEGVKWYPDYADVIAHNKLLTDAGEAGYATFRDVKWGVNLSETDNDDIIFDLFGIERRLITPEPGMKLGE